MGHTEDHERDPCPSCLPEILAAADHMESLARLSGRCARRAEESAAFDVWNPSTYGAMEAFEGITTQSFQKSSIKEHALNPMG